MMIIQPIKTLNQQPNMGVLRIPREDADILMKLPRDMLDKFDKQLLGAPQDMSEKSCKLRDNMILGMIEKAKIFVENLKMEAGE